MKRTGLQLHCEPQGWSLSTHRHTRLLLWGWTQSGNDWDSGGPVTGRCQRSLFPLCRAVMPWCRWCVSWFSGPIIILWVRLHWHCCRWHYPASGEWWCVPMTVPGKPTRGTWAVGALPLWLRLFRPHHPSKQGIQSGIFSVIRSGHDGRMRDLSQLSPFIRLWPKRVDRAWVFPLVRPISAFCESKGE